MLGAGQAEWQVQVNFTSKKEQEKTQKQAGSLAKEILLALSDSMHVLQGPPCSLSSKNSTRLPPLSHLSSLSTCLDSHYSFHTTHATHTLSSSRWDSSCPTQAGRTCYLCKVNPGIYWRRQALNDTNSTKNLNLSLKRYRVRTTSVGCRCGLQGDASLGRSDLFHLFPLFSKSIWVNDKEIALLPEGRF